MTSRSLIGEDYLVLSDDDYRLLGPDDFGSPGLEAIEVLGPFVDIRALGPLITVHDSTIEPHLGIGHHPHRRNERIFYMEAGELDHSDTRNNITGHLEPGDVGLFTEGERGMVHSEWNNGDVPSRIYILVYATDPVPEETSFSALRDNEAPRYDEGPGVRTKEMVGPGSPLAVHGDIRLFTDTTLEDGASVALTLGNGEGGLVAIRDGRVRLGGREVSASASVLFPPAESERRHTFEAIGEARILRTVTGPGFGFRRV
jgi:redox-sensitive bicupin YhaK (pirin superfamily)